MRARGAESSGGLHARCIYLGFSHMRDYPSCRVSIIPRTRRADDAKCQSYRLKAGSGEYAECRHAQEVERRRRYEAAMRTPFQQSNVSTIQSNIGGHGPMGSPQSTFPVSSPAKVTTTTSSTSSSTGTGSCSTQASGGATTINCSRSTVTNTERASMTRTSR